MPKYAELGFAYWLMDEKEKQEQASKKALEMMLKLKEYEGDPRYHSNLGFIYAMLDNKENAVREAKIALALSPPSKDIFKATLYEGLLAEIYTFIGENDKALDMIEKLLSGPSSFSWEDIKYHHVFHKVFKNHPRFISIVKKDEDNVITDQIKNMAQEKPKTSVDNAIKTKTDMKSFISINSFEHFIQF